MDEAIREVEFKQQTGIEAATTTKWMAFKEYLRKMMILIVGWGIFYKEILPRLMPGSFKKAGF